MRIVLFVLLPLALFAVNLKTIKYEGLIHISPMIANDIVGMQVGKPIEIQKIDKAILDFYKQGYFKDIYVIEDEGVLTFHFVEKPTIAKIDIEGIGSGRDYQALIEQLSLKKGDIYDKERVGVAKADIVRFFEDRGYIDTVVEEETEELNEYSIKLDLIVNRGESIMIEDIKYCGAKHYSSSSFETVTANRERELFGWMWGFNDGELKLDQLELDGLRIKDFYMRKGYLDAEVGTPYLETDFNTYEASINYKITEGDQYEVSSVDLIQEEPLLYADEILDELKMTPGRQFNIDKVRKDMEYIKEQLGNKGYAFARVTPDMNKDEEEHTVGITYMTQAGEEVYINDVLISGNTHTKDRVIRREILLAPGDLYNATDMMDTEMALRRSGYFEDVTIDERRVSEEKIDLLVQVKEARTGEFRFGAGYGSYGGISGNVAVSDRNVFGSGMEGTVSMDMSSKSQLYRLSLFNPRAWDSKYSLGGTIYRSKYQAQGYTQATTGFNLRTGRMLSRHWRAYAVYGLSNTELSDIPASQTATYDEYYQGDKYLKSAITPGVAFDDTDDYLLPRRGMTFDTSLEYAGLGGDAEFINSYTSYAFFHGLKDNYDIDLIFRYKLKLGVEFDEGYLPISEKYYLGGINTLRGYEAGSLSPRDSDGNRIGGKRMMSNAIELSQSLVTDGKFRIGAFYDYGMIGDNDFTEIQRSSTGGMIEWISPLGAIDLIFPYAIDPEPGDNTSDFEFSMGKRF